VARGGKLSQEEEGDRKATGSKSPVVSQRTAQGQHAE